MAILTRPASTRQKRALLRLITVKSPGWTPPVTARARVQTPSTRLTCTVDAFFEFQSSSLIGPDSITAYNATWTLRARTRGTGTLAEPYLHALVDSSDPPRLYELPNSYQFTAGLDTVQVDVTLTANVQAGVTTIGQGNWYVRATWEPESSAIIDDVELERLFDLCDLSGTLIEIG